MSAEQLRETARAGGQHEQNAEDSYVGPKTNFELERLRRQHELVKHGLGNKLLFAALDLSKPELRIIDSATADGYFLVDLVASYPELACNTSARYFAADLRPSQIMPASMLPPNTTTLGQDIAQPWPAELAGTFDLVCQRYVLANIPRETAPKAVAGLWSLVKPGGWLQLVEGDMYDVETGPQHVAMERMVEVTRMLGHCADPGPRIESWVRSIPEVKDRGIHVYTEQGFNWFGKAGAEHGETAEMASKGTLNMVEIVKSTRTVAPNFPAMAHVDFDQLEKDLKQELTTVGNRWKLYAAWVRKPE